MIKNYSFKHGFWYHYRFHSTRCTCMGKDFQSLSKFLHEMPEICPHDYFLSGPRGSKLKIDVKANMKHVVGHEISSLAKIALDLKSHLKTNHSKVECFLLEHDESTIAVEVPLWMQHHELDNFENIFNSKEALTGHIDILRIEDDKIWVWDFKPKANKEKYAHVQILFYALMLSKRSGIPLDKFNCGYFDEEDAYLFKPKEEMIK